jgi:hypothetical protein
VVLALRVLHSRAAVRSMLCSNGCTADEAAVAMAERQHWELWDIHRRFAAKLLPTDAEVYPKYATNAKKQMKVYTWQADPRQALFQGDTALKKRSVLPRRQVSAQPQLFGPVAAELSSNYSAFPGADEVSALFSTYPAVFTTSGAWDIRPNPGCCDLAALPKDPARAKTDPRGFGLLAWWTPRSIRLKSMFFATANAAEVSGLHNSDEHIPLSFRDLDSTHISGLVDLKRDVQAHLREVYAFSTLDLQQTAMFFSEFGGCVPVHVQITHSVTHDTETQIGSVAFDDVVEYLEKFGDTKLLRRYPRRIMRWRGNVEDTEHAQPWMASNSSCEGTVASGGENHRQALCKLQAGPAGRCGMEDSEAFLSKHQARQLCQLA